MKISVLIPACHADPFLASALATVREQSYLDWELVVVEGGSRDDTASLVRRFAEDSPQPVRYEHLGRSCAPGALRNRLLELATGDALTFLEPDDTWEREHLANAAALLAGGADLVVSGVQPIDLVKNQPLATVPAAAALRTRPVDAIFHRNPIVTSSAVTLTRALARRVGRFDRALGAMTDRDYWLRCALAGARFALAEAVTCYQARHPSSASARTYAVARHNARFFEKHRALRAIPRRTRRRMLADSLLTLGRLLRQYDRWQSATCFWRAWRCAPFNLRIPLQLAVTGWRALLPRPIR